ncbi:MAG TPA: pyridoxamine 5'-phosphate oxidase [Bacteroidia bacterium]|nr:pyridoxamine 5'-phosphate oxidase [Bacteroidia bacterium]
MDHLKNHIGQLREDFMKGTLSETEVNKNPFVQFEQWLQQAVDARIPEVQAMNLATVSADLKPASRTVYLREFDNHCFCFYTNYQSAKARHLDQNPNAALTFFWPELERQIRIEGVVEKVSEQQSDSYFKSRPYDSKIGAWASRQSNPLTSRDELDQKINDFKMMFTPESIMRPEYWGGYQVIANYYEFWQGRKNRLHDRIVYRQQNGEWIISRIAP